MHAPSSRGVVVMLNLKPSEFCENKFEKYLAGKPEIRNVMTNRFGSIESIRPDQTKDIRK
jgi:hypothetical protein